MFDTMKRGIGTTLLAAAALGLSAVAWGADPKKSDVPSSTMNEPAKTEIKKAPKAAESQLSKHDTTAVNEARHSVDTFLKADPDLQRKLDTAVGYAILPTVGKGAIGIGGASGNGVLFENGKATGKVNLTQVTVGLALGGQSYSELILFEDKSTLDAFKRSQFTMAAQMSAVAASAGASANAKYVSGVQVYSITKGGLMYEASIGGQKFTFTPWVSERVG